MKFSALATIDMDEFRLKWRWTDAKYCLIPNSDLNLISPLNKTDSEIAWKKSLEFPNGDSESSTDNLNFKDTQTGEVEENEILSWLNEKLPHCQILISWQPDTAVITNTQIFIKYWDEFCYPSSDDVTIWPENESWVLQYRHYEQFWYGELASV